MKYLELCLNGEEKKISKKMRPRWSHSRHKRTRKQTLTHYKIWRPARDALKSSPWRLMSVRKDKGNFGSRARVLSGVNSAVMSVKSVRLIVVLVFHSLVLFRSCQPQGRPRGRASWATARALTKLAFPRHSSLLGAAFASWTWMAHVVTMMDMRCT
jgi:hypothetical protein